MIEFVYTKNYRGGVNNLWVAVDAKTGIDGTSEISKEAAISNLRRNLRRWNERKAALNCAAR